jgi:hypothetical protein
MDPLGDHDLGPGVPAGLVEEDDDLLAPARADLMGEGGENLAEGIHAAEGIILGMSVRSTNRACIRRTIGAKWLSAQMPIPTVPSLVATTCFPVAQ